MRKLILSGLLSLLLTGLAFPQDSTLFDDSRLSSIHITISPDSLKVIYDSILSDHYYLATFVFDDQIKRDTLKNVGFRLRGNSSRYSKKKSFKISFNEYVSGRKYQGVKKINLNGEHNDPTMIREKLFYDIWKKAGMVERRTAFVKLFINGSYYGLYTNLEEMEKEWLTRVYSKTSGNLFKCTFPADLVYHGPDQQIYKELQNTTVTGGRVYELQTNKSQDEYAGLVELITVLNQPSGGAFAAAIPAVLNVDHFLKALALDVATGNWDDYSYNNNNYYLYENPADSTFDFITYDPDNTFGIDWFGIDWAARDCRNWVNPNMTLPLAQKIMAVPAFFERYKQYLDTIVRNVTNPDSIFQHIDSMKQLIQQAAEEDTYRTLDYGYTVDDFNNGFIQSGADHVKYGIKPFLGKRRQTILVQLHPAGVLENTGMGQGISIFPNPASETLRVSLNVLPEQEIHAEIFDFSGMKVMEFDHRNPADGFSIRQLEPGIYFLRLSTSNKFYQAKFVKMQP